MVNQFLQRGRAAVARQAITWKVAGLESDPVIRKQNPSSLMDFAFKYNQILKTDSYNSIVFCLLYLHHILYPRGVILFLNL